MVIPYRDDARRLLNLSVALGRGEQFNIFDVMEENEWATTIAIGDGTLVLGGAVTGALEGLRRQGTTSADVLSCPTTPIGGTMTVEDMEVAAGWLASGLLYDCDPTGEQIMVDKTLEQLGWVQDPARVTSLMLAIAVTAGHAGDHDRG